MSTKKSRKKRQVVEGYVYIQSTYNNTIVTITDLNGEVISQSSAGANGFRGSRQATPYAAQVTAETAAEKAKSMGFEKAHVFVKGLGSGREQGVRGINSAGIAIQSITDITPIPHNGCRPPKPRRV